jgi:anti-sigma factor RsiW
MTCDRIEDLLPEYVDGDLGPGDAALVERHLAGCPGCAALAALLRDVSVALASFPEISPSPGLTSKLAAIPDRTRSRFSLNFWLKPSLQPVFAAVTIVGILFTFYMFNPNKQRFNRAVVRQFHRGYSQFEKLIAKAGALTDNLGATADTVFVSLKDINPLGKTEK